MNNAKTVQWTVVYGLVWWEDFPRSGALRPLFQDAGVLAAVSGGEPGLDDAEIEFRCAIDAEGKLAVCGPDGSLQAGPAYADFAEFAAQRLEAHVELHDAVPDSGEPVPEDGESGQPEAETDAETGAEDEDDDDEEAVPAVVVGRFGQSDLLLAASSWQQDLKYLDEGGWRIVLVPDASALSWEIWDRGSRPVAAFTGEEGFRTLEVWLGGKRRPGPGSDFWHAWAEPSVPVMSLPATAAPDLSAVMAKILAPEVPETAGLAAALGLDPAAEAEFRKVLARPADRPVLAAAAAALGFPARAGALAEGSISLDDVAGFQSVTSHPLPRAIAETMVLPLDGNSPAARLQRLVLNQPRLLVAGSAAGAAAAVVLGTAARRRAEGPAGTGAVAGALRAGGWAFAADAAVGLLAYATIRATRKTGS